MHIFNAFGLSILSYCPSSFALQLYEKVKVSSFTQISKNLFPKISFNNDGPQYM